MIAHIFLAVIAVTALMIWGLGVLARRRGGLFRIQYSTRFHKGYQHR